LISTSRWAGISAQRNETMNERAEKDRKEQVKAVASFVLILAIIVGTVLGIVLLVINKRVAKEDVKQRIVPTVEIVVVTGADHTVKILTQGVVESARETMLAAEVGGRVMEISPSFKQGGVVKKGERLLQIDPADYRAALAAAEVRRAEAELALAQEKARVEQAELDWKKLGGGSEPLNPLVLRKPFLAAAEASAASAVEAAAKARRDVERTEILAPFDAGLRSANAEVGAVVAPGTMVAELYAIGDLEVRLPLSLEDFGFLTRDAAGTVTAEVVLKGKIGADEYIWKTVMARVDPEIARETLSAHIAVKVLPTEGSVFPLPPVGLFVKAEITGKTLNDVKEIPRRALLEGNRAIVVMADDKIAFRDLTIPRLTRDTALVSDGLEAGDRVVLTRLSAPVAGMEVEVEEDTEKEDE
jgi:RND family efflux transporter MFP subunit